MASMRMPIAGYMRCIDWVNDSSRSAVATSSAVCCGRSNANCGFRGARDTTGAIEEGRGGAWCHDMVTTTTLCGRHQRRCSATRAQGVSQGSLDHDQTKPGSEQATGTRRGVLAAAAVLATRHSDNT